MCARAYVCANEGEIRAAEGSQQVGAQWRGGQGGGLRVANLGGRRDGTQCDLSTAICSSINHGRIYTHRLTLCSVWGQGRGYFRVSGRGGVGLRQDRGRVGESGERVFHSLKPEWDLSLLYGLQHTTVQRGEFESFTEQPSPLGTSVKVKVSPQTHYHTHTQGTKHICT